MNTTNRTLTFVAVAAFAVLSAVGVKYINRPIVNADFADVGQEFFSAFTDPLKATSLSVAKYDGESREPIAFAVKQNDKGLWVLSNTTLMWMSKASNVPTICLSPFKYTKTSLPLELFNKSSGLSIPLTIK